MNGNSSEEITDSHKALRPLAFGTSLGVESVVISGLQRRSVSEFFTISSVEIMAAGACLLLGGALGYPFLALRRFCNKKFLATGPSLSSNILSR
jgi:hypothetical protein